MAVKLSLLSGPVVVFDTMIIQHDTDTNNFFYKDKSFKQYKDIRGAFGKFLAWSFISVIDLHTLSCLVSF